VPSALTRRYRPAREVSVGAILASFRHGGADPAFLSDPGGPSWWLGLPTPDGPATLRLVERRELGEVEATAWGRGAAFVVERVPDLLGAADDDSGFVPHHPQVAQARRMHPGWRVPRSGLVMHSLVPAVIEQKVTGREAFEGYRRLVGRFGRPAPGAGEIRGLWVAPAGHEWAAISTWEWLRAGVDPARSGTAVRCARYAGRLAECPDLTLPEAHRRLRAIPGVGAWTAAEVAQRALGDADAVSFGDYHVAKDIGWALTGSPLDDDGLAELLEPYAGHRYRVQRLLELSGIRRPRRGPRMALRTHLPAPSRFGSRPRSR
jgi:3-methyladenine DNA glycosylase/8-oxoguanine DNA glycosylase